MDSVEPTIAKSLLPHHQTALLARGIEPAKALAAGLYSVTPDEMAVLLGRARPSPYWIDGLVIPDPNDPSYRQIKVWLAEDAPADEQRKRYLQPHGGEAPSSLTDLHRSSWDRPRRPGATQGDAGNAGRS